MRLTTFFLAVATLMATDGSETALQMANRGAQLYANANYGEAEALYLRALEAWPHDSGSARGRAILSGNLGILLRTTGRYGEAELILLQAIKQLEGMGPASYPDAARLLDNLAILYRTQGDSAKAESCAKRAAPMMDDAERPANRQALGSIYLQQGRYSEAEPLLLADATSADSRTALTAYLNLATAELMQRHYVQSDVFARHALEMAQRALPRNHPANAMALNDLAQACRFEGQYGEAEQRYREAIAIWEESLGPNHPELANGLMSFAAFLHQRERDIAAEALYRRAIRILEQALGNNNPQVLIARVDLADVFRAEGRYSESEKLSRDALAALETALEPDDMRLVYALRNRARLLAETNRKAEAAAILKQIAQPSAKSQPLE
jgi:tetratricopeptide (TPR) repeat protein